MTINLITSEQHAKLKEIYTNYPVLTLQNKGFEGIDRGNFTDEEKQQDKEINDILKGAVIGFSRFQNFKLRDNGVIALRFQYNYSADEERPTTSFIGVGYILLDQLLNGFKN